MQHSARMLLAIGLAVLAACSSSPSPLADSAVTADRGQSDRLTPDSKAQPDGPPALKVGEYLDFTPDADGKVVGTTRVTGSEQYLAVLISLDESVQKTHAYTAQLGSSQPMRKPDGRDGAGASTDLPFHYDHSREVQGILDCHPTALRLPKPWQAAGETPKVGDKRDFKVDGPNNTVVTINAECLAVDSVAAYWIDRTTTPLASIDSTALAEIADGFSKIAVPRLRAYFGHESDVNGDGVIEVLFTPMVQVSMGTGATAYTSYCDLADTSLVPYCKSHGNNAEILYIMPPSALKPPMNTSKAMLEVAIHELQHAIYFYRKFVTNNIMPTENPYITEGLSGLAQDLSGYAAGIYFEMAAALGDTNNLSAADLTSSSVHDYLPSPYNGDAYGSSYLFMRYLFDRAGGDALDVNGMPADVGGMTWLHALIDNKASGMANITGATGLSDEALLTAFWTTIGVSNRGGNAGPLLTDPKLNYRPITTDPLTSRQRGVTLFGKLPSGTSYSGPKTQNLTAADGTLRAGGAEYLLLSASAGAPVLAFTIQTPPAAKATVRLIRIQ
jgi:hypothetical protein